VLRIGLACSSLGEHVLDDQMKLRSKIKYAPLKMHGQEYVATTWAMANMNMIIHDLEGTIEIGDTFKNPKFRVGNRLQTFDRVVSNPMWNQDWFKETTTPTDCAASRRALVFPVQSTTAIAVTAEGRRWS